MSLQGPGTQIRRGLPLQFFATLGSVDSTALSILLRSCGRPAQAALDAFLQQLAPSQTASPSHLPQVTAVLATSTWSAAAIIGRVNDAPDIPVLLTMALTPEVRSQLVSRVGFYSRLLGQAYHEGAEISLWDALRTRYPDGLAWLALPSTQLLPAFSFIGKSGLGSLPLAFPPLARSRCQHKADEVHLIGAQGSQDSCSAMWWGQAASRSSDALIAGLSRYADYFRGGENTVKTQKKTSSMPIASVSPSSIARPIRVGLLGARGYVGREFVRLIASHPTMQV